MTAATPPPPYPTPGLIGRLLLNPGRALHLLTHQLETWGVHFAVTIGLPAAAVALAVVLVRFTARRAVAGRLRRGARLVMIESPPVVDPAGAEALWGNLIGLRRPGWRRLCGGQPHVAFELTWSDRGVGVGIWVPGSVPPGYVEHAIEGAWPGARTSVTDPTPPVPLEGRATGGVLRLAARDWFGLRTEHPSDPLRAVLSAAGELGTGETAAVQVLARPVTRRRLAGAHRAARALRSGQSTTRVGQLLDLITPGPVSRPGRSADPILTADVRSILDKAAHPSFEVAVRYTVTTTNTSRSARPRLRGRAHSLASSFALFTARNSLGRHRLAHPAVVLASRTLGRGDLLSVPELAALAHLPTDVTVAGLSRAGARPIAPPPAVPSGGKLLGDADTGSRRPVALAPLDARYHLHVLGATGCGKSTLLTNLILGDVTAGRGVVVIDPKGDLITDVLDRLPAACTPVLIDPDEDSAPPSMNLLDDPDHDLAVDNLVGIFRRIFEAYWGPRTDDVLRAACLTLLRRPGATLADVPRLLADERFRRTFTEGILGRDPVGLGGFWTWYEQMSDAQRAQVIGPVMNKLRAFLLRDFARRLVGTSASSFDMAGVLDGGVCLVRLPKGILGEETARLIGSFVVARVWQAATARARRGQAARVDAALYIDEAQNFLTLPRSLDEMLAEARGYGLSLVLAHQHLAQLPRDLREAVSANARNKVFFSLSPEDARILARHTTPELGEHDLSHLGGYQAAARLVVAGQETPAFTLRTRRTDPPIAGRAVQVRGQARAAFGQDAATRRADASNRQLAGRRRPEDPGLAPQVGSAGESAVGSAVALSYDDPFRVEHAGQRADGVVAADLGLQGE
ncbi:MAG TPA: TraM recognition domain-containing protein [Mycobacteriales bacterium]|nr:TraM recognition domain-containing protein [Mycobacteriales bacterium]